MQLLSFFFHHLGCFIFPVLHIFFSSSPSITSVVFSLCLHLLVCVLSSSSPSFHHLSCFFSSPFFPSSHSFVWVDIFFSFFCCIFLFLLQSRGLFFLSFSPENLSRDPVPLTDSFSTLNFVFLSTIHQSYRTFFLADCFHSYLSDELFSFAT